MRRLALFSSAMLLVASSAVARDKPIWTATRSVDPITGKVSCVVAAYDRAAGMSFSRTGAIYPIVEMSGDHGLLVGVSSGGRIRIPTGDILWRVDDLPHHEIKAADNPAKLSSAQPGGDSVGQLTEQAMALTRSLKATSTVASGEKAWTMLAEMRSGRGLQYRQAGTVGAYGLPQQETYLTGQMTKKGLKPFPLDASFKSALASCGIGDRAAGLGERK